VTLGKRLEDPPQVVLLQLQLTCEWWGPSMPMSVEWSDGRCGVGERIERSACERAREQRGVCVYERSVCI